MVRRVEPPLPAWEQTTYWVVGVAGVLYGIYHVYLASSDLKHQLQYVEDGVDALGGKQDVADYEWHVYSTHLGWQLPPLLVLHIAVSRAMNHLQVDTKTRKNIYVVSGALAACYLQSWRFLVLLSVTPVPFYLASALTSLTAVWTVSVGVMYLCNAHTDYVIDLLKVTNTSDYFVVIYIWASVFLRCTCFAIERVWSLKQVAHTERTTAEAVTRAAAQRHWRRFSPPKSSTQQRTQQRPPQRSDHAFPPHSGSRQPSPCCSSCPRSYSSCSSSPPSSSSSSFPSSASSSSCLRTSSCDVRQTMCRHDDVTGLLYEWPVLSTVPGIWDVFLYVFYAPLLFSGPPIPYKTFTEQMDHPVPLSRDRLLSTVWKALRICLWFCFNHVMLHVLYFQALGQDKEAMLAASKWTLITTAYLIGQFMTNKYVVIYGTMTQVAKLDGLDLAENPACISYIYAYSDMWKSFDRGLYSCLKRYIYIPVGGSQAGLLRMEAATLATFIFIGYWHGGDHRFLTWAVLNFMHTNLEQLAAYLERCHLVQTHLISKLSEAGMRRLRALLCYPGFLLATTSNMYFLAGSQFAEIYAFRGCLQWDSFLTLGLITYCLTQASKHLEILGCTKFT